MSSEAPLSRADRSTGSEPTGRTPFDTTVSAREWCNGESREGRS